MAYSRNYKKRYYRNKSRYYKKKGKFSRYQTYRYRSSKSQSNQIYQLSKRIDRIEYKTRPQISCLKYPEIPRFSFGNTEGNLWGHNIWTLTGLSEDASISRPSTMLHNLDIVKGEHATIRGLKIWGAIDRVAAVTGVGAYVRVLIYQYRQTRSGGVTMGDLFSGYGDSTVEVSTLVEPLKYHVSSTVKLLYNKVYTINNSVKNATTFNIYIPGRKLLNWTKNSTDSYAKGDIDLCIIYGQNNPTTNTNFYMKVNAQLYYTDV